MSVCVGINTRVQTPSGPEESVLIPSSWSVKQCVGHQMQPSAGAASPLSHALSPALAVGFGSAFR